MKRRPIVYIHELKAIYLLKVLTSDGEIILGFTTDSKLARRFLKARSFHRIQRVGRHYESKRRCSQTHTAV